MSNLYAGSECCGAPLETVGEHDTVDGRHVVIEVCSECGKEYQFFRGQGEHEQGGSSR